MSTTMEQLEKLGAGFTKIGEDYRVDFNEEWRGRTADLEKLKKIGNIHQIVAHDYSFDDGDVEAVLNLRLKRLKRLWLRNTNVTDDGLRLLPKAENLTAFISTNGKLTDGCMKHVGKMGWVEELHFAEQPITDAVFEPISKLRNLKDLLLPRTLIDGRGLPVIPPSPVYFSKVRLSAVNACASSSPCRNSPH